MALQAYITGEDYINLDENIQGLYVENEDGTYRLDVEGVEDVKGLKSALEKERKNAQKLQQEMKKFENVDLDEIQKLREEAEAAKKAAEEKDRGKLRETDDFETREKQLLEKHQKHIADLENKWSSQIQEKDTRLNDLTKALHKELIDSAATSAIAQHKGVPELLLPHVRNVSRVVEDDGRFRVEIVDPDGNPRLSTDPKSSAPMSISELVGEMRDSQTFGRAFEGSGNSGTGVRQGDVTQQEGTFRMSRDRATDLNAYVRAKEQAAKAGATLTIAKE